MDKPGAGDSAYLTALLQEQEFSPIMADPGKHRLQVILTQLEADSGVIRLAHHTYRIRPREYFYPASMVKLPTALLALEKLHAYPGLDWDMAYTHDLNFCEVPTRPDDTVHSIKDDVARSLLLSDNPAFDRLYSWTGPSYLTETLRARGYAGVQITHRLGLRCTAAENLKTHPVNFLEDGRVVFRQETIAGRPFTAAADDPYVVTGYPGDHRSFGPLSDFHRMLIALLLPDAAAPQERFALQPEELRFVAAALSKPAEYYEGPRNPDMTGGALKFLLLGGAREPWPDTIRIYSKTGKALGFLTESALFIDDEYGVAFFLSATVYVNYKGNSNDEDHHYDDLGLPFLRGLGRRILESERSRPRPRVLRAFNHL